MDNVVTILSLPCPMFCFTTFSVYQTNGVVTGEGDGCVLINVITRYLFDWLGKVTINVTKSCIQTVTGLERYCYISTSGHILIYHWLCTRVVYSACATKTAGGTLGRDCQLRLQLECSYRHNRLSSASITEGSVHVECCTSRNWLFSYVQLYKYSEEGPVQIQTPTLLPYRSQHNRPAALVIAQQYFSAFFLSFRFHSHKENVDARFKNVISNYCLLFRNWVTWNFASRQVSLRIFLRCVALYAPCADRGHVAQTQGCTDSEHKTPPQFFTEFSHIGLLTHTHTHKTPTSTPRPLLMTL